MTIFSAAISLFLIFNVIGNIPFFIGMLKNYTLRRQKIILTRELTFAATILLVFSFFGEAVLSGIGISESTLRISGGLILLVIAFSMLFPKKESSENLSHEPYIVPIAFPCMAGPGSITTVMIYSNTFESPWATPLIIMLALIPSLIILLLASNIKYLVGEKGLMVFERLGGLLICLIAIQMISLGSVKLVKDNFPSTGKVQVESNRK